MQDSIRYGRIHAALVGVGVALSLVGTAEGGASLAQPQAQTSAEAAYRTGLTSLANGDLNAAEAALKESLQLEPKLLGSMMGLAEVSFKKGNTQAAEEYLHQALALAPQNGEVKTAWGRYLYSQRKFSEAEAAFKEAIDLAPQAIRPRIDLGDLYLRELRLPKEAIGLYRSVLALDPAHAGAHYALGMALLAVGEPDQAQAEFEEAGRLAPDNPLPFQALGRLQATRKEYEKALEAFAAALKAQPEFVQSHMDRGDVFLTLGEDDQALAEYTEALTIAPNLAEAQVKIGVIHQRNDRPGEARQAYLSAITLDPQQAIAYNNLAWMAAERQEHLDEAVGWAQTAVELAPHLAQFQDTLAWVYRARGELNKAASVLEQASSIEPQQAEIFYHLGVVLAEQPSMEQHAASAFTKALALRSDFPGADDARHRLEQLGRFR